MEKVYKNSSYLFGTMLLLVVVGFYKTYFGLFPRFAGITPLMHFHALMVLLWMSMLIGQPLLIRRKKLALHRLVGKLSYGLVPLMILSIVLLMRQAFMRNTPLAVGGIDTGMIGIADLIFFALFYGLAVYYRHQVGYHARFMVITVLPFINPALGRLGIPGPILALLILIGLLIYERFTHHVYRPYLLALPTYLTVYLLFIFVIDSAMWKGFWWMFF